MAHAIRTATAAERAPEQGHRASPDIDAVVWSDDAGRPLRLIWQGRRWRVTDRPTVITAPVSWWWRVAKTYR